MKLKIQMNDKEKEILNMAIEIIDRISDTIEFCDSISEEIIECDTSVDRLREASAVLSEVEQGIYITSIKTE